MKMIARAAVFVAPLLVTSGLALSPALAGTGDCVWGGTTFSQGSLVNAGGVVFNCTSNSGQPYWNTGGQSSSSGEPVDNSYDGTQNLGDYSVGATLADDTGEAFSVDGLDFVDLSMSWDDFASSTGCFDDSCGGGGGIGGLQP